MVGKTLELLTDNLAKKLATKRRGRPKSPLTLAAEKDAFITRVRSALMEGLEQFGEMLPLAISNMKAAIGNGDLDTSLWVVEKFYGKPAEKIIKVDEREDPVVSLLREMQVANAVSAQAALEGPVGGAVPEASSTTDGSDVGRVLESELTEASNGGRGVGEESSWGAVRPELPSEPKP